MEKRELSVEEWHLLAQQNIFVPMKTTLSGSSMEPLIKRGKDIITVIPVESLNRPLMRGDIVLFRRRETNYVVHRIWKLDRDRNIVQTLGDNCRYPDGAVDCKEILGLVIDCERVRFYRHTKLMLNTEQQREKGIRWMDSKCRRPIWLFYRHQRDRIYYKVRGQINSGK